MCIRDSLLPDPTPAERIAVAREHARLQVAQMGENIGCRELRGLLGHYLKGLPGATRVRESLTKVTTLGEIEAVLDCAESHFADPLFAVSGAPAGLRERITA